MPEHRPIDAKGAALSLLLAALWGANPVAIKLGLADMPPLRLAFMRFVLSAVVIFAYAMLTKRYDVLMIRSCFSSRGASPCRAARWRET